MPCEPFCYRDEDGNIISGIMCSRGKRKLCQYCGRPMTSMCDYPLPNGKTCDAPLCDKHKTTVGHDLDVCREHNNPEDIAKTLSKVEDS